MIGHKQHHQLWFKTDLVVSLVNLGSIYHFKQMTAEELIIDNEKQKYDYTMVLAITIVWFRFFNYFILFSRLSKLIVTLI